MNPRQSRQLIALLPSIFLLSGHKVFADCSVTNLGFTPLNELGFKTYSNSPGGLYRNGPLFLRRPPGGRIVSQGQLKPECQFLFRLQTLRFNKDKPSQWPSGESHRMTSFPRKRIVVSLRPDARHEPVLLHADTHLPVNHETQPAHQSLGLMLGSPSR